MSSKEAEFLKDGFSAEKSCTCAKQSPVTADISKNMHLSPGDIIDTPSSSNAPSSGLEPQPKIDVDAMPSSSGTSRNLLFKIGMLLNLLLERLWDLVFYFFFFPHILDLLCVLGFFCQVSFLGF